MIFVSIVIFHNLLHDVSLTIINHIYDEEKDSKDSIFAIIAII